MKTTHETAESLARRGRWGRRRIETLGWKRMAAIYAAERPGSPVRKMVEREARRCGYAPRTVLALNAE